MYFSSLDKDFSRTQSSMATAQCILVAFSILLLPAITISYSAGSKCKERVTLRRFHSDCSGLFLINTYNLNLDPDTQVLNLAHNEISVVRANVFQDAKLTKLEEISLHDNHIHRIESSAFSGLNMLRKLDISKNRIMSLESAYWPPIQELNMSNNPLSSSFSLTCTTLQVLDLSRCDIKELPITINHGNIEHLNLSNNRIEAISLSTIKQMPLKSIQFQGNPLRCDYESENLAKWLTKQYVKFSPFCIHNEHPKEEFVMLPVKEMSSTNARQETAEKAKCNSTVEKIQREQRIFAIITLSIHAAILLLVVVAVAGYFCIQNKRLKRIEAAAISDIEEEAPPPPYRSYMTGFSI